MKIKIKIKEQEQEKSCGTTQKKKISARDKNFRKPFWISARFETTPKVQKLSISPLNLWKFARI
jgi:hypothetical protein